MVLTMANEQEIIDQISELLDTTEPLSLSDALDSIPEYDSMAILALMDWYDTNGIQVAPADFEKFITIKDLVERAKSNG
jgi:acyl carrier protein